MATAQSPFEMAVFGDSITWGSGLSEDDKFWKLVLVWIEARLGRRVNPQVLAHALAVIAPNPVKDAVPPQWGEIRFRYPSITYEALSDPRLNNPGPEAIDLVLVDGGINDMNPINLGFPWHSPGWVRAQAAEHCGRKMRNLLLPMLDRFPRARVVVTGYFPILSEQSSFAGVRVRPLRYRQRLIELSAAWRQATDEWLGWAVQEANLHASGPKPRVLYATAAFGPENCYGAPDTYLWTLCEAFADRSPVGKRRRSECCRLKPFDLICPFNMAVHPNRKGARAYAAAVIQALGPFLPAPR